MENETLTVCPGAIVMMPLCGMSHGALETATAWIVDVPSFRNETLPVGFCPTSPATSMRFDVGTGFTSPVGGTAERSVTGTLVPVPPDTFTFDVPVNEPGPCAVPVSVTVCVEPGFKVKLVGDCEDVLKTVDITTVEVEPMNLY